MTSVRPIAPANHENLDTASARYKFRPQNSGGSGHEIDCDVGLACSVQQTEVNEVAGYTNLSIFRYLGKFIRLKRLLAALTIYGMHNTQGLYSMFVNSTKSHQQSSRERSFCVRVRVREEIRKGRTRYEIQYIV